MDIWPGRESYALLTTQKLVWAANLRHGRLPESFASLKTFARSVQDRDDLVVLLGIAGDADVDVSASEVAVSSLWRMAGCYSFLQWLALDRLDGRADYYIDSLHSIATEIWQYTHFEGAARILRCLSDAGDIDTSCIRAEREVVDHLFSSEAVLSETRVAWLVKEYAYDPSVSSILQSRAVKSSNPLAYFQVLSHWSCLSELDEILDRIDAVDDEYAPLFLNAVAAHAIRTRRYDVFEASYEQVKAHITRASFEELAGYVAVHVVGS